MNNAMKELLVDLGARQRAGEHMPCPRCGRDTMDRDIQKNAKSRMVDVRFCTDCDSAEDHLIHKNVPNIMLMWKCFAHGIERVDPRTLTVEEIQERVEGGQIEHLMDFYEYAEEVKDEGEVWWARLETMRKCPGLYELWTWPVRALYETRDGDVYVEFRRRDGALQYAIRVNRK